MRGVGFPLQWAIRRNAPQDVLDLLEAGSVGEIVVDTVMATLLPQLTDAKIPLRSRLEHGEHHLTVVLQAAVDNLLESDELPVAPWS